MNQELQEAIERSAHKAAREAVKEILIAIGIDVSSPISTQRDMAALHELRQLVEDPEVQTDLIELRRWRKGRDALVHRGKMVTLGLFLAGFFTIVALGLYDIIKHPEIIKPR